MLVVLKRAWKVWKRLTHLIVDAQNAVLLTIVFVFGVAPAALLARLFKRRLLDRDRLPVARESHWEEIPATRRDVDWAQRPW
jgi:hypothetical protein